MIYYRIRERFPERALEWFCAFELVGWGIGLLQTPEVFHSQAFIFFARIGDSATWGVAMAAIGLLWLAGLIVNGARNRVTSKVRTICATFGFVTYLMLMTGMLLAGIHSTAVLWGWTFFLHAAASAYSVFRAMADHEAPAHA